MGYTKLAGIQWKEKEHQLLEEMNEGNPFLDINLSLIPFIAKLLKSPLSPEDLPVLKLSLSGIVNTMNRSHYDKVKPYITRSNHEDRLDELVTSFRTRGLHQDSHDLLDKINTKLSNSNVEETLMLIDELKRPFLEKSGRTHQGYRVLKIITVGIHGITYEIFRWTQIKLVDGEHTSDCTQSVRQYNEIVYGENATGTLLGRKVDLLIKSGPKDIELSSIEIKKPLTSPGLALEQQCKNLRTNGAILGHLQALNSAKDFDHIVAMDWIGMVGYMMYLLIDVEGVYYGKILGILRLRKAPKDFVEFKATSNLLFAYQHNILNIAIEAQSAMDIRQDLDRLCELIDTQDEVDSCPRHNIFFTPHRTKK
ncbi:hypothetical protein RO3G_11958 [Lichtheimia corymbifera JMRC:FSU:9682]|uniref:Uncharacterized protein n=1 Tax=Lichtheimia corymbifera JMRC:FSU:9682 TaxID=1263082 RepID=A0A068RUZ2_9FUNG|nr:hypothetical protein RO3G_11958 [Lichtheimia corymbifera JMRC:FSU:9682]